MAPTLSHLLKKYSHIFPVGSAGSRFPAILKKRRRLHLKNLDSFAVITAVPKTPGEENLWYMNNVRICQEPSFIHLSGISQPGLILLLNPFGKERETLFLPPKNDNEEFWNGIRFGYPPEQTMSDNQHLSEIYTLTGIKHFLPLSQFPDYFRNLITHSKKSHAYAYFHKYEKMHGDTHNYKYFTRDHNWSFYRQLQSNALKALKSKAAGKRTAKIFFEIKSLADLNHKLRLPLEPEQVIDVKKAINLTGKAFQTILPLIPGYKNEQALTCSLESELKKHSIFGLSFPSIIASGRNAATLHYVKNDEPLTGLVLMDFGLRWGTMHADISRTVPVSGRFNPLQALLYDIVLGALKVNNSKARAGITIRSLNDSTWAYIEARLEDEFFKKGGIAHRPYTLKPHGVSHLIGEQVHDGDPFRLYQDTPMKCGWQISSEPGLYGNFSINIKGKRYSEYMGIRIEDNLIIQKNSSMCLSSAIPRERAHIERLMN